MTTSGKPKNVQIPLTLFNEIIDFLELWDISGCEPDVQQQYRKIFSALYAKKGNMELREAYAGVVSAKDDAKRKQARKAYLELKELNEG